MFLSKLSLIHNNSLSQKFPHTFLQMKKRLFLRLNLLILIPLIYGNDEVKCKIVQEVFTMCKKNDTLVHVNNTMKHEEYALQIKDFDLKSIAPNAFKNLSIDRLILNFTDNSVELEPESFKYLENVSILVVNSAVMKLKSRLFVELTSLHSLSIIFSKIVDLKREAFSGLPHLLTLEISWSNISMINEDTFSGLNKGIKRIWLNNNNISSIAPTSFDNLKKLQILRISYNRLSDLQLPIFHGLPNLSTLFLDHNQINMIQRDLLNNMVNLDHLDLSYNNISIIESGAFEGLSLTILNLQKNFLTVISSGTFSGLLTHGLNLADNMIINIEVDAFKNFDNITIFFKNNNYMIDRKFVGLGKFSNVCDDDQGNLRWTVASSFKYILRNDEC